MKDDSISRQAAIAYAISGMTREIDGDKWIRVSEVRESLRTMPSAEKIEEWLIPQRRGNISWNEKAYAECSVCHEVIFDARSMNYCPKCGARMVNNNE